ncbi:MAG: hypothetical protein JNK46_09110 [Methylobacteriaceae bacterium]|nr:hypothetical protein [Methylobacteriaceae bacterium]
MGRVNLVGAGLVIAWLGWIGPAAAQSCSNRAAACGAACTPQLVGSGVQFGGTVEGCRASCAERRQRCLREGVWVHMGSARRGERESVERR